MIHVPGLALQPLETPLNAAERTHNGGKHSLIKRSISEKWDRDLEECIDYWHGVHWREVVLDWQRG